MNKALRALTTTALAFVITQTLAFADIGVHASLPHPASLYASATVDGCYNNPGPYITLSGELTLGGLNGRLIFRNNQKGTHEYEEDTVVDVVLIPEGEQIQFNKQPSRGGVGGNPWIYVQFFQHSGAPISDEILLGRCVQGLTPTALGFNLPSDASVTVPSGACSNHPGNSITVSGDLTLGGINATLAFRNNEKGTHEYEEPVTVDVVILPKGEKISFAKSPHLGGAGGNPLVYFQFLDGSNNPLSGEIFLGRCTQI